MSASAAPWIAPVSGRPARIVVTIVLLFLGVQPGEAHNTGRKVSVPLQVRQLHGRAGTHQVAFGCLPSGAVTGEVVACEVKIVPPASADVAMDVVERSGPVALPVHQEGHPGVYGAEYRFKSPGTYTVHVRAGDDQPTSFSISISRGLVERLRWSSLFALSGLAVWIGWRLFREPAGLGERARPRAVARIAGYVVVALFVMAVADNAIVPAVGRGLLPLRSNGDVDWGAFEEEPREQTGEAPPSRASTTTGSPVGASSTKTGEWTGRVVARPGAVVDVVVPMTGRVVYLKDFVPRIGVRVVAGQTLALLEHHYVMHDAVHLINERWSILLDVLAAKRQMLEATIALVKSQFLFARDGVSLKVLKEHETAAAIATSGYERAHDALDRHDAQIRESDLVTRPLVSPVAGTISSATFTQGQLVYEGDKLFTIADISQVWVRVDVPEQVAAVATTGSNQPRFSTPALGDETFSGRFVKTTAVVDSATRTVPFFFEVVNPDKRLKLGMTISARSRPETPGLDTGAAASAFHGDAADHLVHAPAVIAVDPGRQADVTAPIWGRIEFAHRAISVGDRVEKGQEIVRLVLELPIAERYAMETRQREITAALEQSRRRKELAEFDYRRAVDLLKTNYSDPFLTKQVEWTEQIYRSANEEEAAVAAQSASYATVVKRRDPKITMVTSPMAGVVTNLTFKEGELDETQQFRRLFTISDLSRVWVVADVFEKDVDVIRRCRGATFTPAGGTAQPLGPPIVIADSLEEKTQTLRVIFQISNPHGALRLGQFATVTFEDE